MAETTRIEPRLYRAIDAMNRTFAVIGGVACFLLAINIIVDVIGRSLFGSPLPGTLDLTTYAWMPTLVALGFGYALLRNDHIRVSLLTGSASPAAQRVAQLVSMLAVAVVAVALAYYGVQKAMDAMAYGESAVGAPWLVVWPFRWVVIVGLIGLTAQAVVDFMRAIRPRPARVHPRDELSKP